MYWILGKHQSKPVILGPYSTESAAVNASDEIEGVRVFKLNTRDIRKATRIIKSKILKSQGPSKALQRYKHQTKENLSEEIAKQCQ